MWTFWESQWRVVGVFGSPSWGAVKGLNEEGTIAAVLLIRRAC